MIKLSGEGGFIGLIALVFLLAVCSLVGFAVEKHYEAKENEIIPTTAYIVLDVDGGVVTGFITEEAAAKLVKKSDEATEVKMVKLFRSYNEREELIDLIR